MTSDTPNINDMNDRSREVFRQVVEGYIESGMPVGSRTAMSCRISNFWGYWTALISAPGVSLHSLGCECLLMVC